MYTNCRHGVYFGHQTEIPSGREEITRCSTKSAASLDEGEWGGCVVQGRKVVLGVCGGIAAYKAVEVLRLLTERGAEVHVIMTPAALRFVGEITFRELSYHPVTTDLFDEPAGVMMRHLHLAETADLFLVAPATTNTLAKLAAGMADNALTTTALSVRAPKLLAPAMDADMYANPITQQNLARLREAGYHIIGPVTGALARRNIGAGRMADPEQIVAAARALLAGGPRLNGKRVLVTAGPTQEPIDPVRYITNRSSGKMGYAVAEQAQFLGAEVTLVSGPTALKPPANVTFVPVRTAQEMAAAVLERFDRVDVVIKAAAVADFRPGDVASEKVKKVTAGEAWTLELVRNPDILAVLGAHKTHQILVGFAAETNDLIENARDKLVRKNLDLVVANDVTMPGAGFDVDTNVVYIVDATGHVESLSQMPKTDVARILLTRVAELLRHKG